MTDYGDGSLSDAQIAAMSPAQRRDLIQRLERPLDEVFPPPLARRMRRNRLTLMVGGAIALTPWTIYLAFTLPDNYVAHNWPATWIGFDCVLTAAVSRAVSIPVIASGGAGTLDHFVEVFTRGCADAALAASIFHYAETSVRLLKTHLRDHGIPVRLA